MTGGDGILATAAAITVSLSPLTASLAANGTQQFTATVNNNPNQAVSWSATAGTVSSSGWFTAPGGSVAQAVTVTATSQADPSKSASVTIQIGAAQAASGVMFGHQTIETLVNTLPAGIAEGYQITATVTGNVNTLSVYVDSSTSSTKILVGLYSDIGGHPGILLTSGNTATFQKAAWTAIPVAPVGITAGSKYWFSLLGTGGAMKFRQKQGPGGWIDELNSVNGLTSLPAKWATGTVYNGGALTSVYGSGMAGAVAITPPVSPSTLAVSPASLSFAVQAGSGSPTPSGLSITNTGGGTLNFTAASDQTWLGFSPFSGTAPANVSVSPSIAGLKAGTYTGHVTLAGGGSSKIVTVVLTVSAIPVQHSVALSWKSSTNAHVVSYSLYRSTTAGSSYGLEASAIGGSAYTDQSVQPGTTYFYVLTAVDDQGRESVYSNESRAIIP